MREQTHETEGLTDLHSTIRKRQRAILRQIATKDIQIARLLTEQDELREQLRNVGPDIAIAWACQGQNRAEVRAVDEPDYEIVRDDEEGAA